MKKLLLLPVVFMLIGCNTNVGKTETKKIEKRTWETLPEGTIRFIVSYGGSTTRDYYCNEYNNIQYSYYAYEYVSDLYIKYSSGKKEYTDYYYGQVSYAIVNY